MKKILIISKTIHFSRLHEGLLNDIRRIGMPYQKNKGESILTDTVQFFFCNLDHWNLKRFARKHGKVDMIYSNDLGLLKQLFYASLHSGKQTQKAYPWQREMLDREAHYWKRIKPEDVTTLLSLVDYNPQRFLHLQDSYALLLKEFGEEVVFPTPKSRRFYEVPSDPTSYWANPGRRQRLKDVYYLDVFYLTNANKIEQKTIRKSDFDKRRHFLEEEVLVKELKARTEANIRNLEERLRRDKKMLENLSE